MTCYDIDTATALENFFAKNVTKEEFALYMRKFAHAAIMLNFSDDMYSEEIEAGYYHLTQFIELLDPLIYKTKNTL